MGHSVMMGARSADNEKALAFAARTGGQTGTFAEAAEFGEIVIHATRGDSAMEVLSSGRGRPISPASC